MGVLWEETEEENLGRGRDDGGRRTCGWRNRWGRAEMGGSFGNLNRILLHMVRDSLIGPNATNRDVLR